MCMQKDSVRLVFFDAVGIPDVLLLELLLFRITMLLVLTL